MGNFGENKEIFHISWRVIFLENEKLNPYFFHIKKFCILKKTKPLFFPHGPFSFLQSHSHHIHPNSQTKPKWSYLNSDLNLSQSASPFTQSSLIDRPIMIQSDGSYLISAYLKSYVRFRLRWDDRWFLTLAICWLQQILDHSNSLEVN